MNCVSFTSICLLLLFPCDKNEQKFLKQLRYFFHPWTDSCGKLFSLDYFLISLSFWTAMSSLLYLVVSFYSVSYTMWLNKRDKVLEWLGFELLFDKDSWYLSVLFKLELHSVIFSKNKSFLNLVFYNLFDWILESKEDQNISVKVIFFIFYF